MTITIKFPPIEFMKCSVTHSEKICLHNAFANKSLFHLGSKDQNSLVSLLPREIIALIIDAGDLGVIKIREISFDVLKREILKYGLPMTRKLECLFLKDLASFEIGNDQDLICSLKKSNQLLIAYKEEIEKPHI